MTRKRRHPPAAYVDVLVAIGDSQRFQTIPELMAKSKRARSTVVDKLVEMQRAGLVIEQLVDGKPGYRLHFPELFKNLEY
jgi:hypothetical protein